MVEDLKLISDALLFGRHIAELNASDNTLVRSYVWGLDLSGTMDGAGGVGGLLWVTLHTASGAAAGTHFCAYDGNGNIVALSAASDGLETARYEYGPFGESIRITGPAAVQNPFRFSTKRTDLTTDLVLYEYRPYSPALGRWLSRDPVGERGFETQRQIQSGLFPEVVDVYAFCHNERNGAVDPYGLKDRKWPFNGRVKVHKKCPKSVRADDLDNKKVYVVGPGQSTPNSVDVDFVEVNGTWYNIGIWTFDVGCNCEPDDGFRQATPEELKAIQEVLKGANK